MKLEEIKEIANQHNIKTGTIKKTELARAIPQTETREACFDSGPADKCMFTA